MSERVLKVLVVDDSAFYRLTLREALAKIPGVAVVGSAEDGDRALAEMTRLQPDLIILDIQMPKRNGIEVLRDMQRRGERAQALIVSHLTPVGAQATTDALLEGAFDVVHKPSGKDPEANRHLLQQALHEKIAIFRQAVSSPRPVGPGLSASTLSTARLPLAQPTSSSAFAAIMIGASTGGPEALRQLLPHLPSTLQLPIFVVQHLPEDYTKSLTKRLNDLCPMPVVEATEGDMVRDGTIFIAPGGHHLKVARRLRHTMIQLTDDPPENGCRPAVDYLLRSAVSAYRQPVLSVILTGMGRDGLAGCRALKLRQGYVMAQHPDSCKVFGMPKAVIDAGVADAIVPLEQMATEILRLV